MHHHHPYNWFYKSLQAVIEDDATETPLHPGAWIERRREFITKARDAAFGRQAAESIKAALHAFDW